MTKPWDFLFLLIAAVALNSCQYYDRSHAKVRTVGPCNAEGDCSAVLEDDTYLQECIRPVPGARATCLYRH